jgi:exosortase A
MVTESKHSRIWACAVLIGFFVLAYFPVWKALVTTWLTYDQYSHGFLIVPLSLYVLWRKRALLSALPVRPSLWGLVLIILSLLVYVLAHIGQIVTVASFSMVTLIAGVILYLFGVPILKELAFPLFFLLFMIPVPAQIYSSLTVPLQLIVSKASVSIADFFGIPIYREGNIIHLPNQTMEVVHACSGLRSMASLLALAAILGYFTLKGNLVRVFLLISAAPTAVGVNVVRVLSLIGVFYYLNLDFTTGPVHTVFGMSIFILALVVMVALRHVLSRWDSHTVEK